MHYRHDEPLTVPVARQVFLLSFHLSQGDPSFQQLLFRAVAWLRPTWRSTPEIKEALRGQAAAIERLPAQGTHPPFHGGPAGMQAEVVDQLVELAYTLDHPKPPPSGLWGTALFAELIREMVRRDHDYLVGAGGRPRASVSPGAVVSPHRDPFLSQTVHYLLLRCKTGCSVVDELLGQMANLLKHSPETFPLSARSSDWQDWLVDVLDVYRRHHPQVLIPLPSWMVTQPPLSNPPH
jgi:DNA-binding transcriptional LysR family regulator